MAASLWAGGLFALLAHARRGGASHRRRGPTILDGRTVCFVVMGVSGVINAIVRVSVSTTCSPPPTGDLIVAKIVALIVLGVFGWVQRRVARCPRWRRPRRVAAH